MIFPVLVCAFAVAPQSSRVGVGMGLETVGACWCASRGLYLFCYTRARFFWSCPRSVLFSLALPVRARAARAWASRRRARAYQESQRNKNRARTRTRRTTRTSWPCFRSLSVFFGFPGTRARGVGVGLKTAGARCESKCARFFLALLSFCFAFFGSSGTRAAWALASCRRALGASRAARGFFCYYTSWFCFRFV